MVGRFSRSAGGGWSLIFADENSLLASIAPSVAIGVDLQQTILCRKACVAADEVRIMFGMESDVDFTFRDGLAAGPAHRRGAGLNPGNRFETVRLHVLGEELDRQ